METSRRFRIKSVRVFENGKADIEVAPVPWDDLPLAGGGLDEDLTPLRPDTPEEEAFNRTISETYEEGPAFQHGSVIITVPDGGFRPGQEIELALRVVDPVEVPEGVEV